MPFLKFSRDKRGYEHFSLVEPSPGRRGKSSRPRVLFWFRTPPQVKVGREPFTEEVRRAIEAQNPGLRFDWARLMATPIPAPDAEHWRERRRVEKAARQAARESEEGEPRPEGPEEPGSLEGQEGDVNAGDHALDAADDLQAGEEAPAETVASASDSQEPAPAPTVASGGDRPAGGRRRRRRGRRKHHQTVEVSSGPAVPAAEPAAPNVPAPPIEEV